MECRITPSLGVVIVAGGKGLRMGSNTPKQFILLGQKPILAHTISAFAAAFPSAEIVVVLPKEHIAYWQNLASRFDIAPHKCVEGGAERFDSVLKGINALGPDVEIIAVQDGVRALASQAMLTSCFECAIKYGSAVPVIECSDSLRLIDGDGSRAIERKTIRAVQTPQMFDATTLRRAYRVPYNPSFTDEASVVEAQGHSVQLCPGEKRNIKITTNEDLLYAQMIIEDPYNNAE